MARPAPKHAAQQMTRTTPAISEIAAAIAYDPESGGLTWKSRPASSFSSGTQPASQTAASWNSQFAGKPALSCRSAQGYLVGNFRGKRLAAHRVAWALHSGAWPADAIDHRNGNRTDNRIINLRAVTQAENNKNLKISSLNTTGVMGVDYIAKSGRYRARIRVNGKGTHLGCFTTLAEAAEVYREAMALHGYADQHGRVA